MLLRAVASPGALVDLPPDHVDVLVVGAGVAGLVAALDLLDLSPRLRVAVLDKARPAAGRSAGHGGGSTPLAQGGLAAAMGPDDSPRRHAEDTLRAGDGLNDPRAVAVVTSEGPARVADLIRRGAVFDREAGPGSALALAREGGQSVARSVRAADATGAEIARALRMAASGRVQRIEGVATALATAGPQQQVVGAHVLHRGPEDIATDSHLATTVLARATVLATGGCGGLYAATTNPDAATADGVALAWRAGAELVDMEFVQFHPTGLRAREESGHQRFLLTEALRGAGAVLRDAHGVRFLSAVHPDAELAPRHVVTKAILEQQGGAWLDATGLAVERLAEEFPTVLAGTARAGYDLSREPVPVEPCQHYMIGGVATDLWGRTTAPGLWAVGEVACPGVHGANRMAGNSLLQASVFGHRAALDVARGLAGEAGSYDGGPPPPTPSSAPTAVEVTEARRRLRTAMTSGAGPIRSADGLACAAEELAALRRELGDGPPGDRAHAELDHALVAAERIVAAATLRTESRGVHWRSDHPSHDPALATLRLRHRPPQTAGRGR